jgi:CHAT domain-containing protein
VGGVVLLLRLYATSPHRLASLLAIALSLSAVSSAGLQPNTSAGPVPSQAAQTSQASRSPLSKLYTRDNPREIEPNTPIEADLAGGETHSYRISLTSGQYLHVIVNQRGVDAVVTIFGPDEARLAEVDRPSGSRGLEGISLIAKTSAAHILQVRSLKSTAPRGRYQIRIDDLRIAKPQDESRILAEKAVTEGEQLRDRGTAESLAKAIEKFEQALALWRAFNEPYEQAIASYGIGLSCRDTGEYQKAATNLGQALLLMRKVSDGYGEAVAQTGLAWTYLYLAENEKALQNFSQALSIRRSIKDPHGEAVDLYGIGWAHALMAENQKALDNFFESLLIRQAIKDRRGEGLTLSGIGNIYYRMGRNLEALDYLNRALQLSRELKDCSGEANTLSGLGWVYSALNQTEKSLDYFHQSLPLRRAAGDRAGEATTLFGVAMVESQRGNLLAARDVMEPGLAIIESLRSAGASQRLRVSYSASVQEYYEFYTDLLMRLHKLYPSQGYAVAGLEASERARARSLLDLLSEARADIRQGVDPRLLESERESQQRLNVAAGRQRQLLRATYTKDQAAAAAQEIQALTTQYEDALAQIRDSSPQYAALTKPQPLSLPAIQQQVLDSDTLLLEYALGEKRSYVWAVTPTTIDSEELPGRSEIETAARRVYYLLTARNQVRIEESADQRRARVAQADTEYSEAAAVLSQMLLGPVAEHLGKRRLAFVTQGALQLVPFGALPAPFTNSKSPKNQKPLIVEHEIVSLPSVSTLALLRRDVARRRPAPKALAVFADPVFTKDDERVRTIYNWVENKAGKHSSASPEILPMPGAVPEINESGFAKDLPRLFGTRWEAEQIISLVPEGEGMKALDFGASLETATSHELGQYRIIHFATHAVIDNEHPGLSAVVLSLVKEDGRSQEGFLRAHDIFNLTLPVELVVLSGCRTALGKDFKGEGLLGMTRAFMYAGAPRVMVSLWSVNDKASAELMTRFYKHMLGERLSPAAALRAAQVEMGKEKRWKSPYYWAPFLLQGDWK